MQFIIFTSQYIGCKSMEIEKIDWQELKTKKPLAWHNVLTRATMNLITSPGFELSKGNEHGYFHHVREEKHFKQMQAEWEKKERVPEEWISKGQYPGIWAAMFNPCNTYSSWPPPHHIIRFYIKDNFFIYDWKNRKHEKAFKSWKAGGRKNPWTALKNEQGKSLEKRMKNMRCPAHKCFYEDKKFGAVIGYLDYLSPVIVLEDAVERVEFLTIYK